MWFRSNITRAPLDRMDETGTRPALVDQTCAAPVLRLTESRMDSSDRRTVHCARL